MLLFVSDSMVGDVNLFLDDENPRSAELEIMIAGTVIWG